MPDYEFTDPHTGLRLTVSGPTPPSEAYLRSIFADAAKKTGTPANDPAYQRTVPQSAQATLESQGALPREQPHMGPITESDLAPVTFGDLIADPKSAMARMVRLTKQGLSDPRNYVPLAVGAIVGGARAMGIGTGTTAAVAAERAVEVPPAPSGPSLRQAVVQAVKQNPDAAIDSIPLVGSTIKGLAKLGRAVHEIRQGVTSESEPAGPASTPATTPNIAKLAPVSQAPGEAPAPAIPTAAAEFPSLDELKLTPAEITTAVKWHEAGVSPETILHRILQSRQLTARTRTTTPDQAAAAVRHRNETGRWED